MLNDPEITIDLDTEVIPEPETPPVSFDPEAIGFVRRIIDEDGFGLVDILTEADRNELSRLGYQLFYFAVDTTHGPVNKIVAAVHDKSYNETEMWFMSKIVNNTPDLEEVVNPDPSTFPTLDMDNLHIPMREKYIFGPENHRWTETPEVNELFLKNISDVASEELDRSGTTFLNDVLPLIGFSKTRLGQLFGWVQGEEVVIEHDRLRDGSFYVRFPNAHYILNEIGD